MPITVRCHACDGRSLCPDKTAGKRIKCPRCGAELHVPRPPAISEPTSPKGSAPDWAASPPPVRAAAPAESEAAADWSTSPPPVQAAVPTANEVPTEPAQQESESSRFDLEDGPAGYEPPEPWYYGFLEKYTLFFMWLWIIFVTLPFVTFSLLLIGAAGRQSGPMLANGFLSFVIWMIAALFYVALVCAILFGAGLILLQVDAARNLRAVRFKTPGPYR